MMGHKIFQPKRLYEFSLACCGTAQARTISRPDDGGLSDRVRAYLHTPHAKRSRRKRLSWAETPMAELKERHGTRRAQRRGRDNMLIQAFEALDATPACHQPCLVPCAARARDSPSAIPRAYGAAERDARRRCARGGELKIKGAAGAPGAGCMRRTPPSGQTPSP